MYIILKKQQEIQPVIATSGNESAEIMIDSANTTIQSQSIEGIILIINSNFGFFTKVHWQNVAFHLYQGQANLITVYSGKLWWENKNLPSKTLALYGTSIKSFPFQIHKKIICQYFELFSPSVLYTTYIMVLVSYQQFCGLHASSYPVCTPRNVWELKKAST